MNEHGLTLQWRLGFLVECLLEAGRDRYIASGCGCVFHHGQHFRSFVPVSVRELRITVIGNRAFGFRRINRPDDFRASGSGNLDVDPDHIKKECVEIAFNVSRAGGFQAMSYDFLFKNNEPVITEISYRFADWVVHACPGHWDSNLNWIHGQMWPEEAQVIDFLEYISSYHPQRLLQ